MLERYVMWYSFLVVWLQEMAVWCSFSQKNEVGNLGLMTKSLVWKKKCSIRTKKLQYYRDGRSYSHMCRSIIRKMSSIAQKNSKRNGDTTRKEDHTLQFIVVWHKTYVVLKQKWLKKIAILLKTSVILRIKVFLLHKNKGYWRIYCPKSVTNVIFG